MAGKTAQCLRYIASQIHVFLFSHMALLSWTLDYATYGHCTVLFQVAAALCSCSNQRGGYYQ